MGFIEQVIFQRVLLGCRNLTSIARLSMGIRYLSCDSLSLSSPLSPYSHWVNCWCCLISWDINLFECMFSNGILNLKKRIKVDIFNWHTENQAKKASQISNMTSDQELFLNNFQIISGLERSFSFSFKHPMLNFPSHQLPRLKKLLKWWDFTIKGTWLSYKVALFP